MKKTLLIYCIWLSLFLITNLVAYIVYGPSFYSPVEGSFNIFIKNKVMPWGEMMLHGAIFVFALGTIISSILNFREFLNRKSKVVER